MAEGGDFDEFDAEVANVAVENIVTEKKTDEVSRVVKSNFHPKQLLIFE